MFPKIPLEKTRFPQKHSLSGHSESKPRLNDPKSLVLPLYYALRYLIELDLKTNQEFRLFPLYPFQTLSVNMAGRPEKATRP